MLYPHTGALHVFSRVSKFYSSSSQSYANDLCHPLMEEAKKKKKYAVSVVTDIGPDYSIESILNMLYFGRLWRDLDLDLNVKTSFAPGRSAKNMVEHT